MSLGGAIIVRTGSPANRRRLAARLVRRIVHRDVQGLAETPHAPNEDGDKAVPLGELFWQSREAAVKIDVMERHPRHAELMTQDLRELGFGYDPRSTSSFRAFVRPLLQSSACVELRHG